MLQSKCLIPIIHNKIFETIQYIYFSEVTVQNVEKPDLRLRELKKTHSGGDLDKIQDLGS